MAQNCKKHEKIPQVCAPAPRCCTISAAQWNTANLQHYSISENVPSLNSIEQPQLEIPGLTSSKWSQAGSTHPILGGRKQAAPIHHVLGQNLKKCQFGHQNSLGKHHKCKIRMWTWLRGRAREVQARVILMRMKQVAFSCSNTARVNVGFAFLFFFASPKLVTAYRNRIVYLSLQKCVKIAVLRRQSRAARLMYRGKVTNAKAIISGFLGRGRLCHISFERTCSCASRGGSRFYGRCETHAFFCPWMLSPEKATSRLCLQPRVPMTTKIF